MGYLKINQNLVTDENAATLGKLCPFGAFSYADGKLEINSACKMCKMCVRKGPAGVVEFVEEEPAGEKLDKSLWRGVCVYADHDGERIHRVTYELIGKARELAAVIDHPVYALLIGANVEKFANQLLRYGVDKVFVYNDAALKDFRVETYTAAFYDFIEQIKLFIGEIKQRKKRFPRLSAVLSAFHLLIIQPRRADTSQRSPCGPPSGVLFEKLVAAALNQPFELSLFLQTAAGDRFSTQGFTQTVLSARKHKAFDPYAFIQRMRMHKFAVVWLNHRYRRALTIKQADNVCDIVHKALKRRLNGDFHT